MGMFDIVWVKCSRCGQRIEFQSKAGNCSLTEYTQDDVPKEIAESLAGKCQRCDCGKTMCVKSKKEETVRLEFE